jgi:hypothetical protein
MEIFKLLDKSNCRKCNEATCLAFAAAVFQGNRRLADCPKLDRAVIDRYGAQENTGPKIEQDLDQAIAALQEKVIQIDLAGAAQRTGGTYRNGKLTLKILGKDVSVDADGQFHTDIHVHAWIAVPVLNYILESEGKPVSGNWVPLRELRGGQDWYRLFNQRCEKPIKKIADTHTDFFDDMIHLFSGTQVDRVCDSDISVVLRALPKIPIAVSYWRPDDGLDSDLHLFFDDTAPSNLNIGSIFTLGTGLAMMFEKLALRHG